MFDGILTPPSLAPAVWDHRKLNVSCADFLNIAATSVIANNSAQQGGGLYVENSDDVNIDFMLTSLVTDDNTGEG